MGRGDAILRNKGWVFMSGGRVRWMGGGWMKFGEKRGVWGLGSAVPLIHQEKIFLCGSNSEIFLIFPRPSALGLRLITLATLNIAMGCDFLPVIGGVELSELKCGVLNGMNRLRFTGLAPHPGGRHSSGPHSNQESAGGCGRKSENIF